MYNQLVLREKINEYLPHVIYYRFENECEDFSLPKMNYRLYFKKHYVFGYSKALFNENVGIKDGECILKSHNQTYRF